MGVLYLDISAEEEKLSRFHYFIFRENLQTRKICLDFQIYLWASSFAKSDTIEAADKPWQCRLQQEICWTSWNFKPLSKIWAIFTFWSDCQRELRCWSDCHRESKCWSERHRESKCWSEWKRKLLLLAGLAPIDPNSSFYKKHPHSQ